MIRHLDFQWLVDDCVHCTDHFLWRAESIGLKVEQMKNLAHLPEELHGLGTTLSFLRTNLSNSLLDVCMDFCITLLAISVDIVLPL